MYYRITPAALQEAASAHEKLAAWLHPLGFVKAGLGAAEATTNASQRPTLSRPQPHKTAKGDRGSNKLSSRLKEKEEQDAQKRASAEALNKHKSEIIKLRQERENQNKKIEELKKQIDHQKQHEQKLVQEHSDAVAAAGALYSFSLYTMRCTTPARLLQHACIEEFSYWQHFADIAMCSEGRTASYHALYTYVRAVKSARTHDYHCVARSAGKDVCDRSVVPFK